MPSLFYSGLLAAAERITNTLVEQDHKLASRLAPLAGHVFELSMTAPPLRCFLVIQATTPHIRLTQVWADPASVRFSGSALDLLGMLGKDSAGVLRDGRVKVEGDMELARQLQAALSASSIDWEYQLSRLIGDVPAHSAGEFSSRVADTFRQGRDSLVQDIDEFLHQERRSLPAVQEVEDFYADIDALRLRVDRLTARLARLQR